MFPKSIRLLIAFSSILSLIESSLIPIDDVSLTKSEFPSKVSDENLLDKKRSNSFKQEEFVVETVKEEKQPEPG